MTKTEIDTNLVTNELNELIKSGQVNQSSIARNIGYSSAAVNTFLNGKYKGDIEAIKTSLKRFLATFKERKTIFRTTLEFEETTIAQNLFSIAASCQYNGEIGVCFGTSGLGKTTAIREYAEKRSGVIIVDPDEKTSPKSVLKQILAQLKIPVSTQIGQMSDDIVRRLHGAGCIIIVDEAENLDSRMFRVLRKIHDRCENTCGLLFVGTEVLYANLLKMKGEYNYVVNRIACCCKLDRLTDSDIKMLAKQVYPDITDDVLKRFVTVSNRNARVLYNTLKRAKDITLTTGRKLDKDIIDRARSYLLVGIERGV